MSGRANENRVTSIVEVLTKVSAKYYKQIKPKTVIKPENLRKLKEMLIDYFVDQLNEDGIVYTSTSTNRECQEFHGFKYALEKSGMPKDFFPKNHLIEFSEVEAVFSYYDEKTDLIFDLTFLDFNAQPGEMVSTTEMLSGKGTVVNAMAQFAFTKHHFPETLQTYEN